MTLTQHPLTDLVTFARASGATYFDSAGVMRTAAVDTLRRDHDPVTHAFRGWLIEGAATNTVLRSDQFDAGVWTPVGIFAPVQSGAGWSLTEDTSTGIHKIRQVVSFTAGQAYTAYVDVKGAGRDVRLALGSTAFTSGVAAVMDFAAGTVTLSGQQAGLDGGAIDLGGGVRRLWVTAVADVTGTDVVNVLLVSDAGTSLNYTGDGASGVTILRAQVEPGALPTSYIRTTTAAVTRAGDALGVPAARLPPAGPAGLTFVMEGNFSVPAPVTSAGGAIAQLLRWIADADNKITCALATDADGTPRIDVGVFVSGNNVLFETARGGVPALVREVPLRFAAAVTKDGILLAANGVPDATPTGTPIPSMPDLRAADLQIGDARLNGHIKTLLIYPAALPAADVTTLSAPGGAND